MSDDFPQLPPADSLVRTGRELIDQLSQGKFVHLNKAMHLGFDRPDWKLGPQHEGRLWIITLHYHEWLYCLARETAASGAGAQQAEELFVHYLGDWIERCDLTVPGARDLAWNSYAVATRIGWWVRAFQALGRQWWRERDSLRRAFLSSLYRQAQYLFTHLEWDLRANHLLRDAVGLAWASRFFQGETSRRWHDAAATIALEQIREQVLDDGAHIERSLMYQQHIMDDVIALAHLLRAGDARRSLCEAWSRMAEYLVWMMHPDGTIALFNDATHDGASPASETLAAGKSLGLAAPLEAPGCGRFFPDAGVAAWHGNPWTIFFDVGPIGADFQPGHAHADTLSFECSIDAHRLFVDPGTFGYDLDVCRSYDRSTAAHNTVCIDGIDSSEMWHIFRVGRRARPLGVSAEFDPARSAMTVHAGHDGYDHLPGRPRHSRTIRTDRTAALEIVDRIEGTGVHHVQAGLLLAEPWHAAAGARGWEITGHGRTLNVTVTANVELALSVRPAVLHHRFGVESATSRLVWDWIGPMPLEVTTRVHPR